MTATDLIVAAFVVGYIFGVAFGYALALPARGQ
jgi:hypothetical protein